jgi:AhpD family alkylhydroperoxidase
MLGPGAHVKDGPERERGERPRAHAFGFDGFAGSPAWLPHRGDGRLPGPSGEKSQTRGVRRTLGAEGPETFQQGVPLMKTRIDRADVNPGAYRAMLGLEQYLATCGLDKKLLDLIRMRVSQMNGCAYCLDMHWKELRAEGETEQRMYSLDAWRESPYYSEAERAALAWAEAVTRVADTRVPDFEYEQARRQFDARQLADLTLAVVAINGWNRLNIAFRTAPGTYQVPRPHAAAVAS